MVQHTMWVAQFQNILNWNELWEDDFLSIFYKGSAQAARFWANFRTKGGSLPNQMQDFMWVVKFQIVLGAGT